MSNATIDRESAVTQNTRTESEWQGWWDQNVLKLVPAWFNLLGWVLIIAALQFVATKSGDHVANWVAALSVAFLWQYLNSSLVRLDCFQVSNGRGLVIARIGSLILTGALPAGLFAFSHYLARVVAENSGA
jgi:hypothetical protein